MFDSSAEKRHCYHTLRDKVRRGLDANFVRVIPKLLDEGLDLLLGGLSQCALAEELQERRAVNRQASIFERLFVDRTRIRICSSPANAQGQGKTSTQDKGDQTAGHADIPF